MDYDDIMERRMDALENAAEKRRVAIDVSVDYLMAKGAECDPFRPDNLREALADLSDEAIAEISSAFYTVSPVVFALAMHKSLYDYWRPIAQRIAERQVDREA